MAVASTRSVARSRLLRRENHSGKNQGATIKTRQERSRLLKVVRAFLTSVHRFFQASVGGITTSADRADRDRLSRGRMKVDAATAYSEDEPL